MNNRVLLDPSAYQNFLLEAQYEIAYFLRAEKSTVFLESINVGSASSPNTTLMVAILSPDVTSLGLLRNQLSRPLALSQTFQKAYTVQAASAEIRFFPFHPQPPSASPHLPPPPSPSPSPPPPSPLPPAPSFDVEVLFRNNTNLTGNGSLVTDITPAPVLSTYETIRLMFSDRIVITIGVILLSVLMAGAFTVLLLAMGYSSFKNLLRRRKKEELVRFLGYVTQSKIDSDKSIILFIDNIEASVRKGDTVFFVLPPQPTLEVERSERPRPVKPIRFMSRAYVMRRIRALLRLPPQDPTPAAAAGEASQALRPVIAPKSQRLDVFHVIRPKTVGGAIGEARETGEEARGERDALPGEEDGDRDKEESGPVTLILNSCTENGSGGNLLVTSDDLTSLEVWRVRDSSLETAIKAVQGGMVSFVNPRLLIFKHKAVLALSVGALSYLALVFIVFIMRNQSCKSICST